MRPVPTRAGTFPTGTDLANGWRIATWLRANAATLRVSYLIWQGRFWSPTTSDTDGWGEPYDGGGYDPETRREAISTIFIFPRATDTSASQERECEELCEEQ